MDIDECVLAIDWVDSEVVCVGRSKRKYVFGLK